MTQFQNLYGLEIRPDSDRNDQFCCCDTPETCQDNADGFDLDECDSDCDTYFILSFSGSQDLVTFPVTVFTDASVNSAPTTNVNYGFLIQFNVSSSTIDQVPVWVVVCDHTVFIIVLRPVHKRGSGGRGGFE